MEDSKLMWALGNYSRFIRPGAVRLSIEAKDPQGKVISEGDTDQQGLMCSAYRNANGQWVMVVINYAPTEKRFTIDLSDPAVTTWQPYRTSDAANENLLPLPVLSKEETAVIPARSIVTFVSE